MKKLLILTSIVLAMRAGAASFFDPFADATASGGSAYSVGSPLAIGPGTGPQAQTNAMGVPWFCLSNTFPVNLGVPVITNDNLSYGVLGTSTGNAVFIPPQPGNMGRVNLTNGFYPFPAAISSGQLYYSFMLKVTDVSTLSATATTNFFAAFTDTVGSAKVFVQRAQAYLVAKASGGGYVLGIGKNKPSPTATTYDTSVRNVGDTLFIVANYDYSTLTANLWINPTNLGAASPATITVTQSTGTDLNPPGIAGFVLGGYTNAAPPGCVVDDVRIATNWATATGAPDIQTQPTASQSKNAGTAATIKATVTGALPLHYQWQRNGVNVSDDANVTGSTTSSLSIATASQAVAGTYTLIITNGLNTATSSASVLNVTDPYISSQPVSQTVSPGTNVIFSITASGTDPLSYQWFKGAVAMANGGNISGASTSTLTITSASVSDVGSYSCYVTNSLGGTTQSAVATLSATDPAITSQPQSVTGNYGTAATFSVTAVGSSPITYQWKHGVNTLSNGGNISGAQSATLTVSSMSYLDNGSYSVVVTSPGGTTTSSDATLSVVEPIITGQPAPSTVASGSSATFTVAVSGAAPITYQWKKNGSNMSDIGNISGSLTSALTISAASATDAASYSVQVADASGTNVLSSSAVLTVLNPPAITSEPSSRTIVAGNKAAFAVAATGAAPLYYQWFYNGSPVPDATNFAYTVANAQAGNDGSYSVVVSNSINTATSSTAVLNVVASLRLYNTNLVVLRAGDGAQTQTLNGNSVFLDQFDPSGNYLNTVCIPDTGGSALIEQGLDQNSSTLTGSALSHSGNNRYLVLAGFNVAAPYTSALQSTTAASVPRAIGTVDTYGQFTLDVADTNAYSGTYFRGAAFDGVNNFWGAGNAGGTYYFGKDAAAATIQTAFANLRSVDIFNGDLYTVSGSGTGTGVLKWSGRPTAATAATTLFVPPAVSSDLAVDSTGTNIYVGTSAGVEKWQFDGSTWNLIYTLAIGGVRYIAVDFSAPAPVIFATTTESSFNRVLTVTDTGISSTATTFATAGVNQFFRGLRFGPVATAASVTSSPTNTTGQTGGSVVLSGTVAGDTPLTIQWSKDSLPLSDGTTGSGSVISGATTVNLTIANLSAADQGSYSFVVTNAHSTATSSAASLTVIDGVAITAGPTPTTANYGGNVVLGVTATGGGTVSYQWKKGAVNLANDVHVSGATTSSLTLSGVSAADSDTYSVLVSNAVSSDSASATVTVNDPAITGQPGSTTVNLGATASFGVTAVGAGTLTYQWSLNGTPLSDDVRINGSTSSQLTINNAGTPDAGTYTVVVTGDNGTATSDGTAVLTVNLGDPVAITGVTPAAALTQPQGTNVTLTVSATGADPKTYQWYSTPGGLIGGANSSQYSFAAQPIGGNTNLGYYVVVDNFFNQPQTSAVVQVTVVLDQKDPKLTVSFPKLTSTSRTGQLTLSGKATDYAGGNVTTLHYLYTNFNGGVFPGSEQTVSIESVGTPILRQLTDFVLPVQPSPGTNSLTAWVSDLSGRESVKVVVKSFFYQKQTNMDLTVNLLDTGAGGSVTAKTKGGPLEVISPLLPVTTAGTVSMQLYIGQGYTFTYTPTKTSSSVVGSVVTNAPGMTSGTSSTKKWVASFIMQPGVTQSVTFARDRFVDMAGKYNGLFSETGNPRLESAGSFTLTLSKTRKFSGKVFVNGVSTSIKGEFDASGSVNTNVGGTFTLNAHLTWDNSDTTSVKQLVGTFSDTTAGWTADLLADKAETTVFSTTTPLVASIPAVGGSGPVGASYAYIKTASTAKSKTAVFALADGGKGSVVFAPTVSGNLPIFVHYNDKAVNVAGDKGVLFGFANANETSHTNFAWIRKGNGTLYPNGFTNAPFTVNHSQFSLPLAFTATNVVISGGGLAAPLSYTGTFDSTGVFTKLTGPANYISIKMNTFGVATVTFGNGNGISKSKGTAGVMTDVNTAGGFFNLNSTTASGNIDIH